MRYLVRVQRERGHVPAKRAAGARSQRRLRAGACPITGGATELVGVLLFAFECRQDADFGDLGVVALTFGDDLADDPAEAKAFLLLGLVVRLLGRRFLDA